MHKLAQILGTNSIAMRELFELWLIIGVVLAVCLYIYSKYEQYKFKKYVEYIESLNSYIGKREKFRLRAVNADFKARSK